MIRDLVFHLWCRWHGHRPVLTFEEASDRLVDFCPRCRRMRETDLRATVERVEEG